MMKARVLQISILIMIVFSMPVFAEKKSLNNMSAGELKQQATSIHPAGLYLLAIKLFKANEKDDAVFWYYVGQIRFRLHLLAHPDLDRSGDPALFSSLQYVVGQPINEYAGGDPDFWARTVRKARDWDEKNPNEFTSKQKYSKEYAQVRAGMNKLIKYVENNKEMIRKKRKANGLENR
jgi:hypothetical protein